MIYLLLSILSSTCIAIFFKFIEKYNVNTFRAIVINYLIAGLLGFLLIEAEVDYIHIYQYDWFPFAFLIGLLFIVMFYVIAISTQKAGISVTTISGRMAMVVPIIFSIYYFDEATSLFKFIGLGLALVAVFFTVYKGKKENVRSKYMYLPILIFFGAGIIDSLVKYSQEVYIDDAVLPVFSAILFSIAFILGVGALFFNKTKITDFKHKALWLWGVLLGIVNFGSIYFFVNALNKAGLSSSVTFGINHIGIVTLTVFGALLIFKEKLNWINWIGIVLSFITIFILSKY